MPWSRNAIDVSLFLYVAAGARRDVKVPTLSGLRLESLAAF